MNNYGNYLKYAVSERSIIYGGIGHTHTYYIGDNYSFFHTKLAQFYCLILRRELQTRLRGIEGKCNSLHSKVDWFQKMKTEQ